MTQETSKKIFRKFTGIVTSDTMDKTIVVMVKMARRHPKYRKHYIRHKKFKVHDPENRYKVGDKIEFVECRPISREKRWKALYKINF